MSHFVEVKVRRMFGDSEVNFTAQAPGLAPALAMAHQLAGIDTPADAPAAAVKVADETSKPTAKAGAKKPAAEAVSAPSGAKQETTAPQAAAQEKTSSTSADEVTYEGHVKPAILQIAKDKGRDVVAALLSRFGASKGPEVKPEHYADFHKDALRVLAGEYDPTVAEEEALA